VIKPIHDFSAKEINIASNDVRFKNQLFFRGNKLHFLVEGGSLFRQFKTKDYFLLIFFYDSLDYWSYSIVILDHQLQLLAQYISPNFEEEEIVPDIQQFHAISDKTLLFFLGKRAPWIIEILDSPKVLILETLYRMKQGWWARHEFARLFHRSLISVRPAKNINTR
jgi:hypothetical protein